MEENLDLTKNVEINQALEEFEIKSQTEEMQKSPEASKTSDISKMTRLVMKWFKTDQKQTEHVLLGFIVVAIGISLFLVLGRGHTQPKLTPVMIEKMKQSTPSSFK